jgi:hypothetical protein
VAGAARSPATGPACRIYKREPANGRYVW